ncbi:MAG: cell division protein CrgA [Sporichthyaceae bacterium]
MPKSRIRKKEKTGVDAELAKLAKEAKKAQSAGRGQQFVLPAMLGLFGFGLLWIVIYYVSSADYPVPAFGNYNLLVGFAFITGGFIAATKWQ